MQTVNLYSSAPLSTQVACAVQGLSRQGIQVVVRPLSELPTSPTRKQVLRLRDQRNALYLQLATVGELLNAFENGSQELSAGQQQSLRAERASLQARLRGLEAHQPSEDADLTEQERHFKQDWETWWEANQGPMEEMRRQFEQQQRPQQEPDA